MKIKIEDAKGVIFSRNSALSNGTNLTDIYLYKSFKNAKLLPETCKSLVLPKLTWPKTGQPFGIFKLFLQYIYIRLLQLMFMKTALCT
jgi:hypothetical protein